MMILSAFELLKSVVILLALLGAPACKTRSFYDAEWNPSRASEG
jgi:hypothetical protein